MNYENYASLDDLLKDANATEFAVALPDLPVTLPKGEFAAWVTAQAIPNWGPDYEPMLSALLRLVNAEPDYGLAMADLQRRQAALALAEDAEASEDDEDRDDEPAPDEDQVSSVQAIEEDADDAPEPGEAAADVAREITIPAIEALREQYPEVAARFTAEQIAAAALRATADVVGEGVQ